MFGAHVPYIDFKKHPELITVIENIKVWVADYPQKIKLCYGERDQRTFVEIDSKFVCQFVLIRRAFSLKRCENQKDNYHSVIDLTSELDNLKCKMQDIVNTYKIYCDQMPNPTISEIQKCDKIVTCLGFDKQWGQYYHNSRRALSTQVIQNLTTILKSDEGLKPSKKLSANALAIKELRVYKSNADDNVRSIKLYFEMPHYNGWFETPLSSEEFWNNGEIEKDDRLVLVAHHSLTNYDLVPDYRFRLMNLLIKNQMRGGDTISIELFDEGKKKLPCKFDVTTYNEL